MSKLNQIEKAWNTEATVRSSHKVYDTSDYSAKDLILSALWHKKWITNELLTGSNYSPDQIETLCGLQLYHFLKYTEELERHLVIPVLSSIIDGAYDELNDALTKSLAAKIITDEAFHSSVSLDASLGVSMKLKIPKIETLTHKTKYILRTIDQLVLDGNSEYIVRFLVSVISESNITSDLAKLSSSIPPGAIRNIISDHLIDEQRHVTFFFYAFERMSKGFSPSMMESIGQILPSILKAFFKRDVSWLYDAAVLNELGSDIIEDLVIYDHENLPDIVSTNAKPILNIFSKLGYFDIPGVRNKFADEGLRIK